MGVTKFVVAAIFLSSTCYCFDNKSILQYLNESGYTLFVRLLTEAHLDKLLDGTGPYTVLAPSNVAIAKVDPDLMVALSNNDLLLKNLLRYHILRGFTLVPEFQSNKNEATLNGQEIMIDVVNNTVVLNNATSITSNSDVILKNGVVHPIDEVLVPPIFSTNNLAAELVVRDDTFSEFLFSLLLTNMTSLIERGEYTIFAPTDAAFTGDIGSIFYRDMPNAPYFYLELLRCHIVPGARAASQLKNGDVLYTLHGSPLTVKIDSQGYPKALSMGSKSFTNACKALEYSYYHHRREVGGTCSRPSNLERWGPFYKISYDHFLRVFIDGAKVIIPDVGASNGVIHGIDSLLFTDDLRKQLEALQQQS